MIIYSKKFQKAFYLPVLRVKAQRLGIEILSHIKSAKKILDLGCGDCVITEYLQRHLSPHQLISPVDVVNTSLVKIIPKIYNGKKLPFTTNYFDSAYTSFTLHHCLDDVSVLKEIVRTTKGKITIIEEIYNNTFEKYLVYANDWIANRLESPDVTIPFHFHTDREWKQIFKEVGCKLLLEKKVSQLPLWFLTQEKMYVIKKSA